ncbi:MAG: Uncharacterized membrane anchored protein XCC1347, partial [uncultured Lysobacter sp.]
ARHAELPCDTSQLPAPVPHRAADAPADLAYLGRGQVRVRAVFRHEPPAHRAAAARLRRERCIAALAVAALDPQCVRACGHARIHPAVRRHGAPRVRTTHAALVREDRRARAIREHHLQQRTPVVEHPADQAGRHATRGADRLSSYRDEVDRLRDARVARTGHGPRTRGRVRAHDAEPHLRLSRNRSRREDHTDGLDGRPGDELHHFRWRGIAGNDSVLAASGL